MAKKAAAGGTPAMAALTRAGIAFTAHTYDHDPTVASFGLEAADALGLDPERVLKTLVASVEAAAGGAGTSRLVVGIVPVAGQLDLKAVAAAVGSKKAQLADARDAERATGYVVGGISPIGQKKSLPTVLDASALQHETVFVSGGRRGLDLELSPADLVAVTRATLASIRR